MAEMIKIKASDGNFYTFDQETELISMNGFIVPSTEYSPVYTKIGKVDGDIPPVFIGILNKRLNMIITVSGRVSKLSNSNNEIDI
jgi:hypothetical protein